MLNEMTPYLRGFFGRCPNCGIGAMSKGFFSLHQNCSHCGMQYESAPGDFTGASVLGYSVTSAAGLLAGVLMITFTEASLLLIMLVGLLVITTVGVLTYRPLKGLWVAFLVHTEALEPPIR